MLSFIPYQKRLDLGIVDPEAPLFQIAVLFKESIPEITMIPQDNGTFTQIFVKAILNGGFVPVKGLFIYHICLGERIQIVSDDPNMARVLLARFEHLLMEPIDLFIQMLSLLPKKENFERELKIMMKKSVIIAARFGQVCTFDWEIIYEDRVQVSRRINKDKGKIVISILGIKENHPFFSAFLEIVTEAINGVIKANKKQIIEEFVASIVLLPFKPLDTQFN